MSATVNILSQVKGLVDVIKKNQTQKKDNNSANRALINKLLQMESAYNSRQTQKTPDYSKPITQTPSKPAVSYKNDSQLRQEASDYVDSIAAENKKKQQQKAAEKIDTLQSKGIKAYQKSVDEQKKSLDEFSKNKEYISGRMIRQGLTNSSIKEDWHELNRDDYLQAIDTIRAGYNEYMAGLNKEIELINSALSQSLSDYNLTLAATYETKLQQLKEEQLKAIEKLNSYNNLYAKNQEYEGGHLTEKEFEEGYSGEKALEMENRYKEAINLYGSMDKNSALKYIEDNSSELKQTLGLYYARLLEEIKNKK